MRVTDANDDLLNVVLLLVQFDTVLIDDEGSRLLQARLDFVVDGLVAHGFSDALHPAIVPVVGGASVSRVDGEELALNVRLKIVDPFYAVDFRVLMVSKRRPLDDPFEKALDLDV